MEEATSNDYPSSIEGLIQELESGNYKHIQIFLSRNKPTNGFADNEKYLIVNRRGFGLYKLKNLEYKDGKIQLEFTNPVTDSPATVTLDINNANPELFVINWKDIQTMFYNDLNGSDDELLELDDEKLVR